MFSRLFDRWLERVSTWVNSMGGDEAMLGLLRRILIEDMAGMLTGLAVLWAAGAVLSWPALRRTLAGLTRAQAWTLAGLVGLAGLLRFLWVPHMPQVYHDEISFLSTAESMATTGLNRVVQVSPRGDFFIPCPAGWSFLIALAFRVFGIRDAVAFYLASTLATLSVFLMFAWLRLLLADVPAALLGAAMLAVLPVHLRLSGSSALETPSLFFLLATLVALHLYFQEGHWMRLCWAALSAAMFVNMRMENGPALMPLVAVYAVLFCPEPARLLRRPALAGAVALLAVFCALPLAADFYGIATHYYYLYESPSLIQAHVASNLKYNLLYWFGFGRNFSHPVWITALALYGLTQPHLGRRRLSWFWGAWFVLLYLFYSLNPSSDFALRHTLDSWRNALNPGLGWLVLAAWGGSRLAGRLPRMGPLLLGAAVLGTPAAFAGFVSAMHVWSAEYAFQRSLAPSIPPNSKLYVEGQLFLAGRVENISAELRFSTGKVPQFLFFPEAGRSRLPQSVIDIYRQMKLENKRVFLYYVSGESDRDILQLNDIQTFLELRPLQEVVPVPGHIGFYFYEVTGLKPAALELLPAQAQ